MGGGYKGWTGLQRFVINRSCINFTYLLFPSTEPPSQPADVRPVPFESCGRREPVTPVAAPRNSHSISQSRQQLYEKHTVREQKTSELHAAQIEFLTLKTEFLREEQAAKQKLWQREMECLEELHTLRKKLEGGNSF